MDTRLLNAWRINLSRYRGSKADPSVVTPRLVELTAPQPMATRYVVRICDAEIELADDFVEETLVRTRPRTPCRRC